jgi:triosephosphate isomerase
MTRIPIIGGNWKKHLDLQGANDLASALRNRIGSHRAAQVVVYPPFPLLHPVFGKLRDSAIGVGAQDLHPGSEGAYTSAVSGRMLRSVGCTSVLVGHSERRSVFGDSDQVVADKLSAALDAGLDPVLCIGETLDERRASRTFEVLARQIEVALSGRRAAHLGRLVIAYEPVWAIGTGVTATPEQAQEAHAWIRGRTGAMFGPAFAGTLRIQYGGSVKPGNAAGLISQPDIDGALVGGASLDAASFIGIVLACSRG